jgi:hypothetical protein
VQLLAALHLAVQGGRAERELRVELALVVDVDRLDAAARPLHGRVRAAVALDRVVSAAVEDLHLAALVLHDDHVVRRVALEARLIGRVPLDDERAIVALRVAAVLPGERLVGELSGAAGHRRGASARGHGDRGGERESEGEGEAGRRGELHRGRNLRVDSSRCRAPEGASPGRGAMPSGQRRGGRSSRYAETLPIFLDL